MALEHRAGKAHSSRVLLPDLKKVCAHLLALRLHLQMHRVERNPQMRFHFHRQPVERNHPYFVQHTNGISPRGIGVLNIGQGTGPNRRRQGAGKERIGPESVGGQGLIIHQFGEKDCPQPLGPPAPFPRKQPLRASSGCAPERPRHAR